MLLCSFARRCHQPGSPDEEEPRGRVVQLSFVVATKCRFISGIERTAMEVVQRSRNQNGRERNGKCGIPLSLQEVTVQQRAQAKPRSPAATRPPALGGMIRNVGRITLNGLGFSISVPPYLKIIVPQPANHVSVC